MPASNQVRFSARPGGACPVSLLIPVAQGSAPPGFVHSLPIAGLLVTPDRIAQLVLTNPRLRVTTGSPSSGKGAVTPIDESDVADTHADLIGLNVRGAGRALNP